VPDPEVSSDQPSAKALVLTTVSFPLAALRFSEKHLRNKKKANLKKNDHVKEVE